jgi:hypothetical protein
MPSEQEKQILLSRISLNLLINRAVFKQINTGYRYVKPFIALVKERKIPPKRGFPQGIQSIS